MSQEVRQLSRAFLPKSTTQTDQPLQGAEIEDVVFRLAIYQLISSRLAAPFLDTVFRLG
jgi:hypothetical protein